MYHKLKKNTTTYSSCTAINNRTITTTVRTINNKPQKSPRFAA